MPTNGCICAGSASLSADFTITPTGGAVWDGCAIVEHLTLIVARYKQGDIAYRKDKALVGVIEKVAIKNVILNLDTFVPIVKYIDTYNALYMDVDLVDQADALALATAYQQAQIASLERYIDGLC